MFCKMAR